MRNKKTSQEILRTYRFISKYVINILDINECSSSPCKNNGECRDGINMFTCSCSPGFEGTECEISKLIFHQYLFSIIGLHSEYRKCHSINSVSQ
jgi:hypothetical protein